ncbi:hypothetical protein JKP88DRAFT_304182 [Tribonema minus]|uniref:UDENN domain-containing protein n=1 Tax=Tribonema minus TaxID=303371 RepID=A0A835Z9L9_9STRA|nr:hypothetical protein JKP88DRAFT_304182 [Tribonema minus]
MPQQQQQQRQGDAVPSRLRSQVSVSPDSEISATSISYDASCCCGWIRALAVVSFDVNSGHKLEQVVPPLSLDEDDQNRIRMPAMPDCNTKQLGDSFYCFRIRKSLGLPLFSSSLLEQTFEYCYALFRQEKNAECARGYFQKSVVLVTRYPYVNLFERLIKVIGPLYFQHGAAVLESALAHAREWPLPLIDSHLTLPFLGDTIYFHVPHIEMPPQVAARFDRDMAECSCQACLASDSGSEEEEEVVVVEGQGEGGEEGGAKGEGGGEGGAGSPEEPSRDDSDALADLFAAVPMVQVDDGEYAARTPHSTGGRAGTRRFASVRLLRTNTGSGRMLRMLSSLSTGSSARRMQAEVEAGFPRPLSALDGRGGGPAEGCYFNSHASSSSGSSSPSAFGGASDDSSDEEIVAAMHDGARRASGGGGGRARAQSTSVLPPPQQHRTVTPPPRPLPAAVDGAAAGGGADAAGAAADASAAAEPSRERLSPVPPSPDGVTAAGDAVAAGDAAPQIGDGGAIAGGVSEQQHQRAEERQHTQERDGALADSVVQQRQRSEQGSEVHAAENGKGAVTGSAHGSLAATGGTVHRSVSPRSAAHTRSATTGGSARGVEGRCPFAEMLLAEEASQRDRQGLFQSMGLYSACGRGLMEHLWHMWELVITGAPVMVVGPNVGSSSAVVLAMVSLASPIYYGGDFRPHFTTFDPDYRDIAVAHDRLAREAAAANSMMSPSEGNGGANESEYPSLLLGVINPLFLKSLGGWPNAIVLPGVAGRAPSEWQRLRTLLGGFKAHSSRSLHKNVQQQRRSAANKGWAGLALGGGYGQLRVAARSANLDTVVTEDGGSPDEPLVITRAAPIMTPDRQVLSQLLDPHAVAATHSTGSRGGHGRQWRDGVRAINDVLLRRHFEALTRDFLSSFDQYFRPDCGASSSQGAGAGAGAPGHAHGAAAAAVGSVPLHKQMNSVQAAASGMPGRSQQTGVQLSIYTDLEALFKRFDEPEFLAELQPPPSLKHVRWLELYRRFVRSPNFRPWFAARRATCVAELREVCRAICLQLREVCRAICLQTPPEDLLRSCMPVGRDHVGQGELLRLLGELLRLLVAVRAARERESGRDRPLAAHMRAHQAALEAALALYAANHRRATQSPPPPLPPQAYITPAIT